MGLEERLAIDEFETLAMAIILRGYYKPGGDSGESLRRLMIKAGPALYPHARSADRVDVGALNYILKRLPDGFWRIRQIQISRDISEAVQRDFPAVRTVARRRPTYQTGDRSYVTAFRGGFSDLLDFISAVTCYQIESDKMREKHRHAQLKKIEDPSSFSVWDEIDALNPGEAMPPDRKNSLLHALTVEFRADYAEVKDLDRELDGRFLDVVQCIVRSESKDMKVVFSDAFGLLAVYNRRAKRWTEDVHACMRDLGLAGKPVFLISSNIHSVVNVLSPFVRETAREKGWEDPDDYAKLRMALKDETAASAKRKRDEDGGIHFLKTEPHMPFCQLVDLSRIEPDLVDTRLGGASRQDAFLLNMDYAFGEEGFFLFNELLEKLGEHIQGVYIVGKAGSLVGERGDIMLPSFFVKQGTGDVYRIDNCLHERDFENLTHTRVFSGGPMLTVAGTFLQNREVLEYFGRSWGALGVEMEGTPYARALAQAHLRGRVRDGLKVGVAYYCSDVPLSGDLLSVPLGESGLDPVYTTTLAVLRNIFSLWSRDQATVAPEVGT